MLVVWPSSSSMLRSRRPSLRDATWGGSRRCVVYFVDSYVVVVSQVALNDHLRSDDV